MGRTWSSLKRRADFLRVGASGIRRVTPGFILQAAPAADSVGRIGFTVSRKVGNAVARNRARRRLRALADKVVDPQMGERGFDLVLIGRSEVLTRTFAALADDLRLALARVAETKNRRQQ